MSRFKGISRFFRKASSDPAEVMTTRQMQLSILATACIFIHLLSFLVSNYLTERVTKEGLTIGLEPPETPLRFVGFLLTALLLFVSLLTKKPIHKRELAVVLAVAFTQFFCDRLEDLGVSFTWEYAAIATCIFWHRIPLHPKILSATVWMFVAINLFATVTRPIWAFFRMGLDEPTAGRLAACATHPNELGLYCALLALIVATNLRTWGWRALWVGLMLLLFLAQSKTSILCYAVGYVFYWRNWRLSPWVMVLIPLASIGYGLLAVYGFLGSDLNLTGRTTLWAVLLDAITRSPLMGYGMLGVKEASTFSNVGFQAENHAHDAALQLLVQGGLLGFTGYCAFVFFMTRTANRSYLGSAVFLFILIHAFTESTVPWTTWAYLFVFSAPFTLQTMRRSVTTRKPAPGSLTVPSQPQWAHS